MNYKLTLNLPFTSFSMKANLSSNELNILKFWNNIDLYNSVKDIGNKDLFIINDGPPYANGDIHIGHAYNKILKDIINKYKLSKGFKIKFVPGWDCHGLPIELNVEREIVKNRKNISIEEFNKKCRVFAKSQIEMQKNSFIRLGVIGDWNNSYKTMDYDFEANIISSFGLMVKNGYIYNGVKPVYWCFDCKSALAEAEVEYKEKESNSLYFAFYFKDISLFCNFKNLFNVGVLVWTTTPWTVPFNEAVAMNPNSKFALIKLNNNGYLIEHRLIEKFSSDTGILDFEILNFYYSYDLNEKILFHPFYFKEIKLIISNHVDINSGTGFVHIAPSYGYDDYKLGLEYNLRILNNIDDIGYAYNNVEIFAKMHIYDIEVEVINILKNNGLLIFNKKINHRYPYCWRHRIPLIFRTTSQWFVKIGDKLINDILNGCDFIKWTPSWGIERMKGMLFNRPDWCISRQRSWGVPLVLVVNRYTGDLHPNINFIIDYVVNVVKENGVESWKNLDIFTLFNIDKDVYYKVYDVLDVWFDSSLVYKYLVNKYNLPNIFDLCIEGSDQYRGWFQVSLLSSFILDKKFYYKEILTHGFVLDHFGKKMSKSLNNVISPLDVINKYGADVLRLWVSSIDFSVDVNISEEILLRICDAYRKIRNTIRFLLSNISDFNPDEEIVSFNYMSKIDLWVIDSLNNLKSEVDDLYNKYNFHKVFKLLYNFCINNLGSKYFDIVKDRLYTSNKNCLARKSVQTSIYYIYCILLKLLSPILSFTAEEAWINFPFKKVNSVFFINNDYYLPKLDELSFFNNDFWSKIFLFKEEINKFLEDFRSKGIIGSSLEVNLEIYLDDDLYNFFYKIRNELNFLFLVSNVNLFLFNAKFNFVYKTSIDGMYLFLKKSLYFKCSRCWNRDISVNYNSNLISICNRCIDNLYNNGENRLLF